MNGWWHIHVKTTRGASFGLDMEILEIVTTLDVSTKLLYVTGLRMLNMLNKMKLVMQNPEIICLHSPNPCFDSRHSITYRPALL